MDNESQYFNTGVFFWGENSLVNFLYYCTNSHKSPARGGQHSSFILFICKLDIILSKRHDKVSQIKDRGMMNKCMKFQKIFFNSLKVITNVKV